MKKSTLIKKLAGMALPLLLAASMNTSCGYINNNLHAVEEGKVYRSAQLNNGSLEDVIKKYEIKTIINLRGKCEEDKDWYKDEVLVCEKYGVKRYDIRFSARSLPKKDSLLQLFEAFDNAEYPLLFHCLRGADRAGLAGTIYEMQYEGKSLEKSLKQLGMRYGHVGARVLDDFFRLYEKFGDGKDLRTWVEEDYDEMKYKDYFKAEEPKLEESKY